MSSLSLRESLFARKISNRNFFILPAPKFPPNHVLVYWSPKNPTTPSAPSAQPIAPPASPIVGLSIVCPLSQQGSLHTSNHRDCPIEFSYYILLKQVCDSDSYNTAASCISLEFSYFLSRNFLYCILWVPRRNHIPGVWVVIMFGCTGRFSVLSIFWENNKNFYLFSHTSSICTTLLSLLCQTKNVIDLMECLIQIKRLLFMRSQNC